MRALAIGLGSAATFVAAGVVAEDEAYAFQVSTTNAAAAAEEDADVEADVDASEEDADAEDAAEEASDVDAENGDVGAFTADGVYSVEQAEAGKQVYDNSCAGCHGGNLTGTPGGPGIAGVRFDIRWEGRTLDELFTYTRDFMPAGNPGSLTENQYLSIIAYILERNEFPPSEDGELPADVEALGAIIIGAAE